MGKKVTSLGKKVTLVGREDKGALKKHAATIHCSNSLSLLQRKISNALLYHAYNEMLSKEEHDITVRELCRLIGYHGNNHAVIKEALRELIATVIEWNVIDDKTGNENWTASSIIASVSLEGPLCYYAYSPRMKQLLHSPSMFGKIDLVIQSRFRSSYGLALYENCIRYRGLPQTKWFEMSIFRKLMGVQEGMYDVFRDFKRRVLDKAIDEVNMYSDLIIAAEYVKEGRKVVRVRFTLKDRAKRTRLGENKNQVMLEEDGPLETLRTTLLQAFQLTPSQVKKLLKEHDVSLVESKVQTIMQSRAYKRNSIENKAAYLISTIKNDDSHAEEEIRKKRQKTVMTHQAITHDPDWQSLKRTIELIRRDYQQYREKAIYEAIEAFDKDDKQIFMTQFFLYAEPVIQTVLQVQRRRYSRENILDSPQLKALLRQFALRELDVISLLSIEEFVSSRSESDRMSWQKLKSFDPDHPLIRFQE